MRIKEMLDEKYNNHNINGRVIKIYHKKTREYIYIDSSFKKIITCNTQEEIREADSFFKEKKINIDYEDPFDNYNFEKN